MIGLVFFFNSALALSETKILANQHIGAKKILNTAL